ncbi:hypothetical protein A5724_22775 [Mycobacterium sp. ACS1612]|uniref:FAD-binding oxidoreductase n=1 Tax=Mycobacterium sp. ACS1612 TaxID=1834117 RepID=UPI000800EFE2|nr:FAD-binding protein [Mycobacterium sp. ACS1612]OBF30841.1 hypothetical protein A5724_22775 [Mycobacterium sp. ACS1612]
MTSNDSSVQHASHSDWNPETVDEAAECLRSAAHDRATIDIAGAGTAQNWGGNTDPNTVIHTGRIDSILSYEPADMTIQVGAGMRVADLQAVVAEHNQRLAIDAARIHRGATVGGLLATADQGPSQLAFGGPRDLVIGAGLAFVDGHVARSGGNVIKNVAGYDLARLVSGSLGTLALITHATFRLHPIPAATGTMTMELDIDDATACARRIAEAALNPVAAEWINGLLLIRFEGTGNGVQERLDAAMRIADRPCDAFTADEAAQVWLRHALGKPDSGEDACTTEMRALARPTDVPALVQDADRIGSEQQATCSVAASVLTGRVDLTVDAPVLSRHADVISQWRQSVERLGGSTVLRDHPRELNDMVAAWGSPPSAVAAMRAIKTAYDPNHLLGRGRFHPWF